MRSTSYESSLELLLKTIFNFTDHLKDKDQVKRSRGVQILIIQEWAMLNNVIENQQGERFLVIEYRTNKFKNYLYKEKKDEDFDS